MSSESESPETLLDSLREHPEWTERERDRVLDRLITRFPPERVAESVRPRLQDLSGADAEVLLRLVEANPRSSLPQALAEGIEAQSGLAAERLWEALSVLENVGILAEYPALAAIWEELNELLDEQASIEELVHQIEHDPDGIWLALQGLDAVETEVQRDIVAGFETVPIGPGLAEFLRLLVYSHDDVMRDCALAVLAGAEDSPPLREVWQDLMSHHPLPAVRSIARDVGGQGTNLPGRIPKTGEIDTTSNRPQIARSWISSVDGEGRAWVVLEALTGSTTATAAFRCDLELGCVAVQGWFSEGSGPSRDEVLESLEVDMTEPPGAVALSLLAACQTLNASASPPSMRYWVEATAGRGFAARPFAAIDADWSALSSSVERTAEHAAAVLGRCADWADHSPLTFELAEEILLRERDPHPDPKRDAGAFRYLFDKRLVNRIELYRRMLIWMCCFWKANGEEPLARSAMVLAGQLADAQNSVPGHPFSSALMAKSLSAAQAVILGREQRTG